MREFNSRTLFIAYTSYASWSLALQREREFLHARVHTQSTRGNWHLKWSATSLYASLLFNLLSDLSVQKHPEITWYCRRLFSREWHSGRRLVICIFLLLYLTSVFQLSTESSRRNGRTLGCLLYGKVSDHAAYSDKNRLFWRHFAPFYGIGATVAQSVQRPLYGLASVGIFFQQR